MEIKKDFKGNEVKEGTKLKFKILFIYGRMFEDVPYTIGTVKGNKVVYEEFGKEKSFPLENVLNGTAEYLGGNPTHGIVV